MFNMTLMDLWNDPAIRLLRFGAKTATKAAMTAYTKSENEKISTSELSDLTTKAHNGDSNAQYLLAMRCYENQEFDDANYWLRKSARQGNEHAQEILGMMQGD